MPGHGHGLSAWPRAGHRRHVRCRTSCRRLSDVSGLLLSVALLLLAVALCALAAVFAVGLVLA
jgi:hypothetical protein